MAGCCEKGIFELIDLAELFVGETQFVVQARIFARSFRLLVQTSQQAWIRRANQTDNEADQRRDTDV